MGNDANKSGACTKAMPDYYVHHFPKPIWEMKIGDLIINHSKPINWWKRFWLRFMGWEVNKLEKKLSEKNKLYSSGNYTSSGRAGYRNDKGS